MNDSNNCFVDVASDELSQVDYVPFTSQNKSSCFDIGVVIALQEEGTLFFESVRKSKIWDSKPDPKMFWSGELPWWEFELEQSDSVIRVVVAIIGEMGTEHAGIMTRIMVDKWAIPFLVNIGITGSLDRDLKIGSVLVPSQVTHYAANVKVKDKVESGYDILYGTRGFQADKRVLAQVASFLHTTGYNEWQLNCASPDRPDKPKVEIGHHASANMLIDSKIYKKELKQGDRKLMSCDMESAGCYIANDYLSATSKVLTQFIALRCISDMAADKAATEADGERAVMSAGSTHRGYAMANATHLFMAMVKSRVLDADVNAQIKQIEGHLNSFKEARKVARMRPPLAKSSVESIIKRIKDHFYDGVTFVKSLDNDCINKLMKHFGMCTDGSRTSKIPLLVDILRENGLIKPLSTATTSTQKRKSCDDGNENKMPRVRIDDNLHALDGGEGDAEVPMLGAIAPCFNTPKQEKQVEEDNVEIPFIELIKLVEGLSDSLSTADKGHISLKQYTECKSRINEIIKILKC